MLFPAKRLRFRQEHAGKTDPAGFLVMDIKGVDIEGASSIIIPMAEIDRLRAAGDVNAERLNAARKLFEIDKS